MSIPTIEPCTKCGGLGPKRKQRKTCIQCSLDRVREWKDKNPERYAQARKAARLRWHERNMQKPTAVEKKRAYYREYHFMKKYGMSMADFESLLAMQNGACAICSGRPHSMLLFHVDHDHVTGKVRGILCQRCNMSLGGFGDSADLLTKAISYLKGVRA